MKLVLKILLPMLVLAACSAWAYKQVTNKEEPKRRPPRIAVNEVEVQVVAPTAYTVKVHTRGTVRPRTQGTLIPEVTGRIVEVSPRLRAGEFFEEGDVLLRIDSRDYDTEVVVANANLAEARTRLAEESARAGQAARDWQRLGEQGTADSLVLREPQLAGARAGVAGAEARLAQAQLALERTIMRAPYAGRTLELNVDVGQYVSPGTALASIYAVDYVEVRLPLTANQLDFVRVPELYRSDEPGARPPGPSVSLTARSARRAHTWQGNLVRAEGAIDTESRQLFVIAQVDDPYGEAHAGQPPLKVGQFVEAVVTGITLEDVYVIPRGAVRAGRQVMLVDAQSHLHLREVSLVWSDQEHAVVDAGLAPGERMVVSPLGPGMDGVKVQVREASPDTAASEAVLPATGAGSQ